MNNDFIAYAKETLEIELTEAKRLLDRLDEGFVSACHNILNCRGKIVISGIGKSGHIGKKIAATLASTGTPAFFLHPAEALHGDLGMISHDDVLVFISYSGRAKEFDYILPVLNEKQISLIAMTGDKSSPLARAAKSCLDISVQREACPIGVAPTSSAVNTLMMGDALAMALMRYRGFKAEDFARSHPGGSLGAKLLNKVKDLMVTGDKLPKISPDETVLNATLELSRTGLGIVVVSDESSHVVGVFTDGDLRRWVVKGVSFDSPISKIMTQPGFVLSTEMRAGEALTALYDNKINSAPVVDSQGILVGALNLHRLHEAGIA
ncbi:arabinose-5-phosphate isomerase GutQ [Aeromonas veronii]|uniref:arabinose-5-phosphate isomerase GutQ n=1 Tax=Aeromonas veronii TaxID=654 RepID=UPI002F41245B